MTAIATEKDDVKRKELAHEALRLRIELARIWERMLSHLIAATDTPGELGTIANIEQHNRSQMKFLDAHDEALEKALGSPLPEVVEPSKAYTGDPRIIVPTVRALAAKGEALQLKFMAVDREPVSKVALFWRPLGKSSFHKVAASHIARSVYTVTLPSLSADVEYYIQAETAEGKSLVWPPTAPSISQTLVVR